MDRRFLASNGQVADRAFQGHVHAETFVEPESKRLSRQVWLRRDPEGAVDRELLYGDVFDVIEVRGDHAFGRAEKDGYVGWVPANALSERVTPTHWVAVRTTWVWAAPDFKVPPLAPLHMTSRVKVTGVTGEWAVVEDGRCHVPVAHLRALGDPLDQLDAARAFLGTPYVWAGNSGFGIDCSGLVQVTARAAGLPAAPDSDLQEAMAGKALDPSATLIAGDLVFWKGHVALATGEGTLIHANAHHMAVVEEPVDTCIARIAQSNTGEVTSRLRPDYSMS